MTEKEKKRALSEHTDSVRRMSNEPTTDIAAHIDAITAGRQNIPDSAQSQGSPPSNKKTTKPEPKDNRRWKTVR